MQNILNIFKLLSDETRLRVILLLKEEELCVCQISGITGIAQPKISKALSKLRDLDLVIDRRVDKFVYYRLKEDHVLLSSIVDMINTSYSHQTMIDQDFKGIQFKDNFLSNCNTTQTKQQQEV